jgi:excisionase family DNA binding protein
MPCGRKISEKQAPRQSIAAKGRTKQISPEEAATLHGVSTRTIRYLISDQKIRTKKVGRSWFVDHESVISYRDKDAEQAQSSPQDKRDPKGIAAYQLFLDAVETPDLKPGEIQLDSRVDDLKLRILEAQGAGFFSYGEEKRFPYQAARSMMGGILGFLYPLRCLGPQRYAVKLAVKHYFASIRYDLLYAMLVNVSPDPSADT